jgi:hypothetical protein
MGSNRAYFAGLIKLRLGLVPLASFHTFAIL